MRINEVNDNMGTQENAEVTEVMWDVVMCANRNTIRIIMNINFIITADWLVCFIKVKLIIANANAFFKLYTMTMSSKKM